MSPYPSINLLQVVMHVFHFLLLSAVEVWQFTRWAAKIIDILLLYCNLIVLTQAILTEFVITTDK